MNNFVKETIEDNIKLLKTHQYDKFYSEIPEGFRGAITSVLLQANFSLLEHMKTIPKSMFENCAEVKTLIIPDNIETIENYAFFRCLSLRYVSFPKDLKHIGWSIFSQCSDRLTSIEYRGTIQEFRDIKSKTGWAEGSYIRLIKCQDGQLVY